jgi:hypothetical protein
LLPILYMCSRMLHVSCMRMMVDDIDLSMAAYTHTFMAGARTAGETAEREHNDTREQIERNEKSSPGPIIRRPKRQTDENWMPKHQLYEAV